MSKGSMPPGYPCFLLIWMLLPPIIVNNKHTLKWWSRGYEDCQQYFLFLSNSATNGLPSVSSESKDTLRTSESSSISCWSKSEKWGTRRFKPRPSHTKYPPLFSSHVTTCNKKRWSSHHIPERWLEPATQIKVGRRLCQKNSADIACPKKWKSRDRIANQVAKIK